MSPTVFTTVDSSTGEPKHKQVQAQLLIAIEKRLFPPGTLLPSEKELARRFGVSRETVRHALLALQQDHYLSSVPGIGWRVSHRRHYPMTLFDSFTEAVRKDKGVPSSKCIECGVFIPGSHIAGHLGLRENERVTKIQRLRLENGQPRVIQSAYVSHSICHLDKVDWATSSLYSQLQSHGIDLTGAQVNFGARPATEAEVTLLGLKETDFVIWMTKLSFGTVRGRRARPIEYMEAAYPPDAEFVGEYHGGSAMD